MLARSTGLVFDERFLNHDTGTESLVLMRDGSFELEPEAHPSAVQITRRTKQMLDGSGLTARMQPIAARPATTDELQVYHSPEYIAAIRAYTEEQGPMSGPWGEIEEDSVLSPGSFEAALYAAGGAIEAVSAVLNGAVRHAFALLRPPGHHALRNRCMGFCVFNNAVIAAHYARNIYGLKRIMIVDWDVHHGNGTQDAFYDDPGVLFLSLHQQNWYPALAGELDQVGSGPGTGYTVNIPLPPGTGDRGYRTAFEKLVLPIGREYRPELIIISAGQDANWLDPLGHMMMTMAGFTVLSQLMLDLANEVCDGRLVLLQEGGYSSAYVPYCTVAAVIPLVGYDPGIVDLYATSAELKRCMSIYSSETQEALTEARTWHQRWWPILSHSSFC